MLVELHDNERPTDRQVREKLAARGVGSLTDAELLSILIREGTGAKSALEIAEGLLDECNGSMSALARNDITTLRMTGGIGMSRAATLAAAFEIADRIGQSDSTALPVIVSKEDVVTLMKPVMGRLGHEEMWVLYLSSVNSVIEKKRVSQGGVTSLVVDNKLIVKRAVELLASSVIIVHNHPSGVAEPSPEDIILTKRISEAAALFDIVLIDHIIMAGNDSYSFRHHSLV